MKANQLENNSQLVVEQPVKQKQVEVLTTKQVLKAEQVARLMAQLLRLDLPETLTQTGLTQTGPALARLAQLYAQGVVHLN